MIDLLPRQESALIIFNLVVDLTLDKLHGVTTFANDEVSAFKHDVLEHDGLDLNLLLSTEILIVLSLLNCFTAPLLRANSRLSCLKLPVINGNH